MEKDTGMSDGNLARFAGDAKKHGRGMSMVFWKDLEALLFNQNRRGALRDEGRGSSRESCRCGVCVCESQSTTKLTTSGSGKKGSKRKESTLKEEQQTKQRTLLKETCEQKPNRGEDVRRTLMK